MTAPDYYELLQVHPAADAEAVEAAYARLRERYDTARLNGAADELLELARAKLAALEEAYATLSDPQRRAAYDVARSAAAGPPPATLDYRPLPPAGHAERPRGFDARPLAPAGEAAARPLVALVAILGVVLVAVIAGLLITGGGGPTAATPPATASPLDQLDQLIAQARAGTEQNPESVQAWVDYGNLLYDSAQIIREQAPESELYQQRLPRWLEAAAAYDRALALNPDAPVVLGDRGASRCFYGAGTGDQSYVQQGLDDLEQATQAAPQDARLLLNLGSCLVSADPPRTAEAVAAWQRILEIEPSDSGAAQEARRLLAAHSP